MHLCGKKGFELHQHFLLLLGIEGNRPVFEWDVNFGCRTSFIRYFEELEIFEVAIMRNDVRTVL